MPRSKSATQAHALSTRHAAILVAQSAPAHIRDAVERQPESVLLTAAVPTTDSTNQISTRLLSLSDRAAEHCPAWMFVECPEWYTMVEPIRDAATGKVIRYATKRDVESWDKSRRAALNAILDMDYETRTRADGSIEWYIPEPCNVARLLSYILEGNMQRTIESSADVLNAARVTKSKGIRFTYYTTAGAMLLDKDAYTIMLCADELNRSSRAASKASEAFYADMTNEDTQKRMDRAVARRASAAKALDKAWAVRHTIAAPADESDTDTVTTEEDASA